MGWRLIATLATGAVLLDEHLDSLTQVVGMITVLATVTWYLWSSSYAERLGKERDTAST